VAIQKPRALYEIPFGSIQRDLFNGEEVPAQRWVDLSEEDGQGITLVNTSKYGFNVEGNSLNMTLLRGSIDPDPLPDLGEHTINYALAVHEGGWSIGSCMREGENWNIPLVVLSSDFHEGPLPTTQNLVQLKPDNVRLAAMKRSQDGKALVLRLVEVEGKESRVQLEISPAMAASDSLVRLADTLESSKPQLDMRLENGCVSVPVRAYGIVTIRVNS
jgi:alpha-mannosidase